MKTPVKILIVAALAIVVVGAIALRNGRTPAAAVNIQAPETGLPLLLDLGANKCVPCKMMAPILEDLRKEYAGRMNVQFIDVWENPDAAKMYHVDVIPTQIFFNADGMELFRHVGFFSKEDILAKWKEVGVDVTAKPTPATPGM